MDTSESVTSWTMPLMGLRGDIFVSLLFTFSTSPAIVAAEGLQTSEKGPKLLPKNYLKSWKEKSATSLRHLPGGVLTKNEKGKFTVKFLNLTETKTMKNKIKEMTRSTKLGSLCKFFNHLRLKVSNRIARRKLRRMKHQMEKHRMRGLLPKMFSKENVASTYKEGRNMKITALAKRCFNQTRMPTMAKKAKKAKQESSMITI